MVEQKYTFEEIESILENVIYAKYENDLLLVKLVKMSLKNQNEKDKDNFN